MKEIVNRLNEAHRLESMKKAHDELKNVDPEKLEYVKKAYDEYIHEYGKYGTDEEENMHPEEIKRDWMLGAIEDDLMDEEEFERIFKLIDDADDSSMAYA